MELACAARPLAAPQPGARTRGSQPTGRRAPRRERRALHVSAAQGDSTSGNLTGVAVAAASAVLILQAVTAPDVFAHASSSAALEAASARDHAARGGATAPALAFQLADTAAAQPKAANPREAIRAAARAKALAQSQSAVTKAEGVVTAPAPAALEPKPAAEAARTTRAAAVPAAPPPPKAVPSRRSAQPQAASGAPSSSATAAALKQAAAPPAPAAAPAPPAPAAAAVKEVAPSAPAPVAAPAAPAPSTLQTVPVPAAAAPAASEAAKALSANGAAVKKADSGADVIVPASRLEVPLLPLPTADGEAALPSAQASAAAASAAASAASAAASAEVLKAASAAAALSAGAATAAGSAASGVASVLGGAASEAGAGVAAMSSTVNAALAAVVGSFDAAADAAGVASAAQLARFTAAATNVLPAPLLEVLNAVARDNALAGRLGTALVGGSVLLAVAVRQALYGGYSGDLSARAVETLLYKEARAYLVDLRPAAARDAAGVPDLRKQARPKSVVLEVEALPAALRGAVRAVRELELERAALRVRGATPPAGRVVLMDAGGGEARELARALTRIGGRRAYTLSGGFSQWAAAGLRVKPDYTSSPLTAVTEDLEVITAQVAATTQAAATDVVSDPVRLSAYAAAAVGVLVAASQWELVLQEVGVLGLMATTVRWLLSYESLDELAADVASGARQAASVAKAPLALLGTKLPK